ncbi:MAG TPA: PAS domain S-box protein, partial [Thermoanaerobaculia bacterium]
MRLESPDGKVWGTVSVWGSRVEDHRAQLFAIGSQLTRWLELTEAARLAKEQADLYGPLIEEAVVAVYSIRNGRFSFVNQKFAQILGYTKEELLALESFADIIPEEERERVSEIVRSREAGEHRALRYVTKVRTRDGRLIDAEIHGSSADTADGRLVIGAAVDVTDRESADKQIRDREEFLRVIAQNIADIVLIVDRNGTITYISGSVESVLGYAIDDRQGRQAFETVHPDDRAKLMAHLAAFKESERFNGVAFRFRHKNGSWRVLELRGANFLEHPQIRGWLITASDITDRKRLEQELEQLNRLTSLGRLAAQVAHEFNNVMMGIQTPVDLIRRRTSADPQLTRFTDMIGASIGRGKRITADILRFGRPAQLALRSVDVRDLLTKTADELRPLLPEKTRLSLDLPEAPLHMHADASQLSQVLINLGLNAKDAMLGKGGTLTLGARPGSEHTARSACTIPNS